MPHVTLTPFDPFNVPYFISSFILVRRLYCLLQRLVLICVLQVLDSTQPPSLRAVLLSLHFSMEGGSTLLTNLSLGTSPFIHTPHIRYSSRWTDGAGYSDRAPNLPDTWHY